MMKDIVTCATHRLHTNADKDEKTLLTDDFEDLQDDAIFAIETVYRCSGARRSVKQPTKTTRAMAFVSTIEKLMSL